MKTVLQVSVDETDKLLYIEDTYWLVAQRAMAMYCNGTRRVKAETALKLARIPFKSRKVAKGKFEGSSFEFAWCDEAQASEGRREG